MMNFLVWFLIYLYGISMLVAIFSFFSEAPLWLIGLNLVAIFSLFATPFGSYYLYIGLSLLPLSAWLNGSMILGKNKVSHLISRLMFSLLLLLLYYVFIY